MISIKRSITGRRGPEMRKPRACDLHWTGAYLVSEGGLELTGRRDHEDASRVSCGVREQVSGLYSIKPGASGYTWTHPRQYHAKYHGSVPPLRSAALPGPALGHLSLCRGELLQLVLVPVLADGGHHVLDKVLGALSPEDTPADGAVGVPEAVWCTEAPDGRVGVAAARLAFLCGHREIFAQVLCSHKVLRYRVATRLKPSRGAQR